MSVYNKVCGARACRIVKRYTGARNGLRSNYYTVGSLAKLTSTTEHTLRFYDRKGLLMPSGYNVNVK
jgi:hypothetical protein